MTGHATSVEEFSPVQLRFRDLLDHGVLCAACRAKQECPEAQRLYRVWRAAGGPWAHRRMTTTAKA